MDKAGIVFICVIFAITMALLGFCCLKFFSSEEKYERNPGGDNLASILPVTTTNSVALVKKHLYFRAIPPYIPKSPPLDVGNSQITGGGETSRTSDYNLPLPPKPGLVAEPQSVLYALSLSSCPPKPPLIEVINMDTPQIQCPYPIPRERRRRTPSPVYKTSYSPRTSLYFSESAGPISGIKFSSENLDNSSNAQPPSYSEAMQEQEVTPAMKSQAQFSEYKPCR